MGQPKYELKDNGMDAPGQDWQWELLERSINKGRTAESTRAKTHETLSKKRRKEQAVK